MSNMNVKNIEQSGDVLTFTVENINVSLANAVRRVILANIPSVVFKTMPYEENQVQIIENTTRLNNEILKHRLSCVPIHIPDLDFPIDNYVVECDVQNDSDATIYVTTADFKIKNIQTDKYLVKAEVNRIFPANSLTGEHIIFARLRPKFSDDMPGEKIKFQAKLTIGTASQNSAFNVVSACSYAFTPDPIQAQAKWPEAQKQALDRGASQDDMEFIKQNWMIHDAKRFTKKDSFDFLIETIGIYTNEQLVHKACDYLIEKFASLSKMCDEQTLDVNRAEKVHEIYNIKLEGESYTVGKALEYAIHKMFYYDTQTLKYVGFNKAHPHDTYSTLAVAFTDKSQDKVAVYDVVKRACESVIQEFNTFKGFF